MNIFVGRARFAIAAPRAGEVRLCVEPGGQRGQATGATLDNCCLACTPSILRLRQNLRKQIVRFCTISATLAAP